MSVLVWLEWPEKCFRVNAEALKVLRSFLPAASSILRVRSEKAFLAKLPNATHVITWHFKKEWYERAVKMVSLSTPGAGRELVDYIHAPKHVKVHFGGYHGAIIAESVVGFMFAWAHGFFRPELVQSATPDATWGERWPRALLSDKCSLVAGTQAVIVGYGRIGRAIGAKLEALGVRIKGFTRKNVQEIDGALRTADWLVFALPSDTGSDNLLNAGMIAKLSKKCVVINIGRGNAIDEEALISALKIGRIAGAYLDVFKNEPGPLSSAVSGCAEKGILSQNNASLPVNLIKMPHSSAFCDQYLAMCFKELKDDG
ncbi:MAG: hypothetical protein J6R80_04850, partial [Kiritimatiellae bacterium]|nr:hypothetical protein [Kiritimatiellia bacterium]